MLLSAFTFVVLTTLAMLQYPGGSKYEVTSTHYLFLDNFFSDLGATRTYVGHGNVTSCVLFIIAMAAVGLSLLGFATSWRVISERRRIPPSVRRSYQISAILSGVCFVGIGATPWNLLLVEHDVFVRLAFVWLLVFVISMVVAQIASRWPWPYVVANFLFMAVLVVYVGILVAGPSVATHHGLRFQVVAQKIMVYSSIGNLFFQARGVRAGLIRAGHPRLAAS